MAGGVASPHYEEDEPWDQKPGYMKAVMHVVVDDEDKLDDGELPSLTPRNKAGRLVNGRPTTRRPLSPPSAAGIEVNMEQRKFWGQMDDNNDGPEDDDDASSDDDEARYDDDEADMPEDERRATRGSRRRELSNMPRQRDELVDYGDDDDYYSSIGNTNTFATLDSEEAETGNICDETLTAIGNMCGGAIGTVGSKELKPLPAATTRKATLPLHYEKQEEHTAIEVEFVEPDPVASKKRVMAPEKKNAYLNAMATKAKQDFWKKKDTTAKVLNGDQQKKANPSQSSRDEDIYKSFDAVEKRKFLGLINSGVSPRESTHKILNERDTKTSSKPAPSTQRGTSEKRASENKRLQRSSILAFWKKNRTKTTATETTRSVSAEPSRPEGEHASEKAQADKRTSRAVSTGRIRPVISSKAKSNEIIPSALSTTQAESAQQRSVATEDALPPPTDVQHDGIDNSVSRAIAATKSDTQETLSSYTTSDNLFASKKTQSSQASETMTDAAAAAESDNESHKFARSGLNYYDAIRREEDERAATPVEVVSSSRSSSKKHFDRRLNRRALGFAALADRRTKSAPRGRQTAVNSTNDIRQDTYAEVQSPRAGTLAASSSSKGEEPAVDVAYTSLNVEEQSKAQTLAQIEEDLLRTTSVSRSAGHTTNETPETVSPAVSTKKKKNFSVDLDGVDVAMDSYFHSKASQSRAGVSHDGDLSQDAISVFTSGTGVTGMTSGTAYTQSSRVRRPGAAKIRLARAKSAERPNRGWHESIRKAAISQNRVWDPKHGWIDYKDPRSEEVKDSQSKERIQVSIDRSTVVPAEKSTKVLLEGTSTQLSSQWHEDNINMATNDGLISKEVEEYLDEKKWDASSVGVARSVSAPRSPIPDTGDASAWLQSMRNASAALARDGQTWNPERGWVRADGKPIVVPDVVDFSTAVKAKAKVDEVPSLKSVERNSQSDAVDTFIGDVEEGRTLQVPPPPPPPPPVTGKEKVTRSFRTKTSTDKSSRTVSDAVDVLPTSVDQTTRDSQEKQGTAQVSEKMEEFVQLGNGGVVNSHQHDEHIETLHQSMSSTPLLDSGEVFPSIQDRAFSPLATDVVKEKMDKEDLGLFPTESGRTVNTKMSSRDILGNGRGFSSTQSVLSDRSSPSRRRGAGPVDMDEVDETWDSDDSQRHSKGWDQSRSVDSFSAGSIPSHAISNAAAEGVKTRLEQRTAFTSKPVPKIKQSRRDTSPIRRTTTTTSAEVPRETVDWSKSEKAQNSKSIHQETTENERRLTTPHVARSEMPVVTPEVDLDEELEDVFSERRIERADVVIATPEPTSTTVTPPPVASVDDTPTSPVSPSVRALAEEWETRSGGKMSGSETCRPSSNAEWKSFLGKKVRAEREAAVAGSFGVLQRTQDKGREPEGERAEKIVRNRSLKSKESDDVFTSLSGGEAVTVDAQRDDDSLFQFDRVHVAPTTDLLRASRVKDRPIPTQSRGFKTTNMDEISELSPIRIKDDNSDIEVEPSEAYGPEDADRGNFFKRLAECAAPVMPRGNPSGLQKPHLAFLTPNGAENRFMPANLCGRPDTEDDEIQDYSTQSEGPASERPQGPAIADEKPKTKVRSKASRSRTSETNSSVTSEDFGAKTAYLEALAMKTAVSKPRNSSRRRDRPSGSSVVSTSSSAHSEKWKAFLERKRSSTPSKMRSSNASDVSKAAEKYAAEKVEEMMSIMSSESRRKRSGSDHNSSHSLQPGTPGARDDRHVDSVKAAEDLAAARVEAMMAALSSSQVDEAEI